MVVASAGNTPGPNYVDYPAAYPGVVAVSGIDRNGRHAKISVSGEEVTIAAPSDDIWSINANGGYRTGTGTSDSAAIVSGAAALIRSRYPDLTAEEVIHRLTATATDKGPPGHDPEYGHGIVNLVAALTADVPPLPQPTPTTNPTKITPTPTAQAIDRDGAGLPWGTIGCGILTAIAAPSSAPPGTAPAAAPTDKPGLNDDPNALKRRPECANRRSGYGDKPCERRRTTCASSSLPRAPPGSRACGPPASNRKSSSAESTNPP